MSDNEFFSWYRRLRLEFYENHPDGDEPTEFHITNTDSLRLIDLARQLTPELRQKFMIEGERKTFSTLFDMKVIFGAKESRLA